MSLLANSTDLVYTKKDKQVLAKLQAEKDAREGQDSLETMSTASTLKPSSIPSAAPASAPRARNTPCGKPHSQNRPCDAPECKSATHRDEAKPSKLHRLSQKLGLGPKAKEEVDPDVVAERQRLDNLSEEERRELRANIRNRPVQMDAGVVGGSGAFGGMSAGGNSMWRGDEEFLAIGKDERKAEGRKGLE